MRALGVDFGLRRIGFAVSDRSGTLARPFRVEQAGGRDPVAIAARVLADLARDDDPIEVVVVGLPRRLDGSPHEMTAATEAFAARLGAALGRPIVLQDERLSSHEAESRLSERYRDWRERKARVDAAAAAVILQDFLDARPRPPAGNRPERGETHT